jgi:hypothetical protein
MNYPKPKSVRSAIWEWHILAESNGIGEGLVRDVLRLAISRNELFLPLAIRQMCANSRLTFSDNAPWDVMPEVLAKLVQSGELSTAGYAKELRHQLASV